MTKAQLKKELNRRYGLTDSDYELVRNERGYSGEFELIIPSHLEYLLNTKPQKRENLKQIWNTSTTYIDSDSKQIHSRHSDDWEYILGVLYDPDDLQQELQDKIQELVTISDKLQKIKELKGE